MQGCAGICPKGRKTRAEGYSVNGVNHVIIIGNLGSDPDARYLPSGAAVTNFSVATSEQWKDKATGEKKERTEWHRCVCFGRQGEIAAQYLRKGSKVYVEGSIQTDKYEKDGQTRYSTQIKVKSFQMLDSRSESGAPPRPSAPQPQAQTPDTLDDFDDDIPF